MNENWEDAPTAFVRVRNVIVHPGEPRKRSLLNASLTDARYDAWWIGLWYLELVILFLLDYTGQYSNRISEAQWKGDDLEIVPWAK